MRFGESKMRWRNASSAVARAWSTLSASSQSRLLRRREGERKLEQGQRVARGGLDDAVGDGVVEDAGPCRSSRLRIDASSSRPSVSSAAPPTANDSPSAANKRAVRAGAPRRTTNASASAVASSTQ